MTAKNQKYSTISPLSRSEFSPFFVLERQRSFQHVFHLAKTYLSEKFSALEFQHFQKTRIFLPIFCPGSPLKNLSSKVFPSKELCIFSKGPIFTMAQTHVNISEIITGVESSIFSSHGEAKNADLLRGEIVKSIICYKPSLSLSTQSKEEIKILQNFKRDKIK